MVLKVYNNYPKTIHILGLGKVGSSFLELLNTRQYRLTAVSDSRATLFSESGLNINEILNMKRFKKSNLISYENAVYKSNENYDFVNLTDIVIDVTPTNLKNSYLSLNRSKEILKRGCILIFAAKDALAYGADELIGEYPKQIGINAVIGGTGLNLIKNLQELRNKCQKITIVGNATTTAIINEIENGLSLQEGIGKARKLGLLEANPTFDFDGTDAAIKLSIVARAIFGIKTHPENITRQHIEKINPELLQFRKKNGRTTRLVGTAFPDGFLKVAYEEVVLDSPLCTTTESVAYQYSLKANEERVYVGSGLGPVGTAKALLEDLSFLCSQKRGSL